MELVRNYEKRILLFFLGIALILGIRFPVFADEVQYPQDVRTEPGPIREGFLA